jgi:signal transduction histidine kinase
MTRARLFIVLGLHVAVGGTLLGWASLQTGRQQREIEQSLLAEASILAGSLGPGLAAASNAVREFDEIVAWKLLDNARLFAELEATGSSDPGRQADIVEANGLDTVAFVARDGTLDRVLGFEPPPGMLRGIDEILAGRAEETVLGSTLDAGIEHLAAAVASPSGGAVLVSIHASAARTFVRRLGVANLLERLVGASGVLYLSYREEPGAMLAEATWDGGPIPPRPGSDEKLRSVRGRLAFEADVPVDAPAGSRASLRIGLDGAPLEDAAAAGMQRAILVGIVLVGYALATVSFALVSRLRSHEKGEAARRLAEAETARRRSDRLAAAGALTAGLAHEVRSPLNAISLAAQRVERKHPDPNECKEFARLIRGEVRRLEGVLREFLDLARPVGENRQTVDLAALAGEVLDLLRPEAEQRGVRLAPVEGRAEAHVDREAVHRSIINLARNAIEASPEGSLVRLLVECDAESCRLHVIDEGPGIDPELRDKVFEAFVTTRADGAGLGLSLVKRVAEEHGGSCTLVNGEGGGGEACLTLPSQPEKRT